MKKSVLEIKATVEDAQTILIMKNGKASAKLKVKMVFGDSFPMTEIVSRINRPSAAPLPLEELEMFRASIRKLQEIVAGSFSGKTPDSESGDEGSTPSPAATDPTPESGDTGGEEEVASDDPPKTV